MKKLEFSCRFVTSQTTSSWPPSVDVTEDRCAFIEYWPRTLTAMQHRPIHYASSDAYKCMYAYIGLHVCGRLYVCTTHIIMHACICVYVWMFVCVGLYSIYIYMNGRTFRLLDLNSATLSLYISVRSAQSFVCHVTSRSILDFISLILLYSYIDIYFYIHTSEMVCIYTVIHPSLAVPKGLTCCPGL